MRIRILIAFSLFLTLTPFCEATESKAIEQAFERIDAYMALHMKEQGSAAGVLALTSRESLLREQAYGFSDLERRTPATTDTLFQIGSITKSFTSIALLQLVDEGRLRLEAPVTDYLPWFSVRSDFEPIQVHHLLTHTAGIPANRDDLPPSPYMALALREQATAWRPGERFHYSNVGYQVLHVLLETVSGKGWAEVVGQEILQPLGMLDTEPAITHSMRGRQAVGYLPPLGDRPHHVSRPLVRAPFFEYDRGDGCLVATARDMAAYLRMLLGRGRGPSERILSESSFDSFSTPWIRPWSKTGYGYGIAVREREGLQLLHSGGTVGASAMIVADLRSGLGAVVMLTGPGNPQALAVFALQTLEAAVASEPLPDLPPESDPFQVENARNFSGTYRSPKGESIVFTADGDHLSIHTGERSILLEVMGVDTFYSPDPEVDRHVFRFDRDEDERVVELTHGPRWFTRQALEEVADVSFPAGWSAYEGRYVSGSPFFPGFEIFIRRGRLWAMTLGGGETEAGEEMELLPLGGGLFRPGEEISPERLRFADPIAGKTWSASWSGHAFYRAGIH